MYKEHVLAGLSGAGADRRERECSPEFAAREYLLYVLKSQCLENKLISPLVVEKIHAYNFLHSGHGYISCINIGIRDNQPS